VYERIRRPDPCVQEVAAALLRMDPCDRQAFIHPLIALIMHVWPTAADQPSAPGTPTNGVLRPRTQTLATAPDAGELEPV
jgi:hypothetical protein